jgi:chorismate mutase / prephenate dehydratase
MGKKKSTARASSRAKRPAAPSPAQVRGRIERIDRQLLDLANERARLSHELAAASDEQPIDRIQADQSAVDELTQRNPGPLAADCVRALFRELASGTRALERKTRVAYLGPAYSYSHLAAIERFGQSSELVPVASIGAVFEEVRAGQADFGVVPIENSTDGRIADTLDNFARSAVRICGEVQLRIRHCLLGLCPRSEIQEVYSRPQALSQCRNWLSRHLPAARLVEVTSTSTAAQLARDKQGAAAVASREAGVNYRLEVLAADIEDNPSNITRFAVLGRQPARRTGRDKAAVMFELEHRPGALADALGVFKRQRVNLTWLESFPMHGSHGAYLFFVEIDGHQDDLRVRRAIEALTRRAVRLEMLGSYAKSPPQGNGETKA